LPVLIFSFPGLESSLIFSVRVYQVWFSQSISGCPRWISPSCSVHRSKRRCSCFCTQWCSSSTRISLHRTSSAGQVLLPSVSVSLLASHTLLSLLDRSRQRQGTRPASLCREDSRAESTRHFREQNFFSAPDLSLFDVSVASLVIRFSIFPAHGSFPLPVSSCGNCYRGKPI
jgi:hypothetical protein